MQCNAVCINIMSSFSEHVLDVEQAEGGLDTKEAEGLGAGASTSPMEQGGRTVTAGQLWQLRALIEGFRGYRHVASDPPKAVIVWFKCGPSTLMNAASCLSGIILKDHAASCLQLSEIILKVLKSLLEKRSSRKNLVVDLPLLFSNILRQHHGIPRHYGVHSSNENNLLQH